MLGIIFRWLLYNKDDFKKSVILLLLGLGDKWKHLSLIKIFFSMLYFIIFYIISSFNILAFFPHIQIHWSRKQRYCLNFLFSFSLYKLFYSAGGLTIGFDIEWKPTFRKGDYNKTAVIQICTHSTCYIFHVSRMRSKFIFI